MHATNCKLSANVPSSRMFCGGPPTVFGLLDITAINPNLLPMLQFKFIMLAFAELINENYVL